MRSIALTSASLLLKVAYEDGKEKVIGFAKGLSVAVSQGHKNTFVVDSPFPAEMAQGTQPMIVKGSLTTYLPKGSTPESSGLVPYRLSLRNDENASTSKFMHLRVYDRTTDTLVFSADYCKVTSYNINMMARGIVEVQFQFDGMYLTPGNTV
jgi:hypothetical protein